MASSSSQVGRWDFSFLNGDEEKTFQRPKNSKTNSSVPISVEADPNISGIAMNVYRFFILIYFLKFIYFRT